MVLKDIPLKKRKPIPSKKSIVWNTRKTDGWIKFKDKTEANEALLKLVNSSIEEPETIQNIIEREMTKVKHSCFGKVKLYSKTKNERKLESLQKLKLDLACSEQTTNIKNKVEEINNEIINTLEEIKSLKYENDIKQLEDLKRKKGKSAATFRLKENIVGSKKSPQEQMVIIDPQTGKNVYDPEDI